MIKALVIGRDASLWPQTGSVVLVDDYCRPRDTETKTEIENRIVTSTSWPRDSSSYDKEARIIEELAREYLPYLSDRLNNYHNVKFSNRYWERIVSHWLTRTLEMLVVTYNEIVDLIELHQIKSSIISRQKIKDLVLRTSRDLTRIKCSPECWVILRSEVVRAVSKSQVDFNVVEVDVSFNCNATVGANNTIGKHLLKQINDLTKISCRWQKVFVMDTSLPAWKEALLKLSLYQIPHFYVSAEDMFDVEQDRIRAGFFDGLGLRDPLRTFVQSQLCWLMPQSFLERYAFTRSRANHSGLPKSPKAIVTSQSFDTDDFFKIWASERAEEGASYVVMQHGNNFGTNRYGVHPEIGFADRYLTWGWRRGKNTRVAFCQTATGHLGLSLRRSSLLLLRRPLPMRELIYDHPNMYKQLCQAEEDFFLRLLPSIRKQTQIKDHPTTSRSRIAEGPFLGNVVAEPDHLDAAISARKLYHKSRICIFGYYSTGFLECMSTQTPTLMYLPEGIFIFNDEVQGDFLALKDVGIIHTSMSSAAEQVNEIWKDVELWWNSSEVIAARRLFAEKYARFSRRPIRDLRSLIKRA